jgi:hypothetical protein
MPELVEAKTATSGSRHPYVRGANRTKEAIAVSRETELTGMTHEDWMRAFAVQTDAARADALDSFDLAPMIDLAYAIGLCLGGCWRLAMESDYQADVHEHSGHDRELARESVYRAAHDQVATMFPADYDFPTVESFEDGDGLDELVYEGLRNICSVEGSMIRAVVSTDGEVVTTIEAELDGNAEGWKKPLHVIRTAGDGTREELALILPDYEHYEVLASLLVEGAEALAEAGLLDGTTAESSSGPGRAT